MHGTRDGIGKYSPDQEVALDIDKVGVSHNYPLALLSIKPTRISVQYRRCAILFRSKKAPDDAMLFVISGHFKVVSADKQQFLSEEFISMSTREYRPKGL